MLPSWFETAEPIYLTLVGLVGLGAFILVTVEAFVKGRRRKEDGRREMRELIHEVANVVDSEWVRRVYSALDKMEGRGERRPGGPYMGQGGMMALTRLEAELLKALRDLVRAFHDVDEIDDLEGEVNRATRVISDAERQERQ